MKEAVQHTIRRVFGAAVVAGTALALSGCSGVQ